MPDVDKTVQLLPPLLFIPVFYLLSKRKTLIKVMISLHGFIPSLPPSSPFKLQTYNPRFLLFIFLSTSQSPLHLLSFYFLPRSNKRALISQFYGFPVKAHYFECHFADDLKKCVCACTHVTKTEGKGGGGVEGNCVCPKCIYLCELGRVAVRHERNGVDLSGAHSQPHHTPRAAAANWASCTGLYVTCPRFSTAIKHSL